ncbi:MAG: hypothetical protein KKA76_10110 [Proteobacteria bacterium]|nr:hypothetical protein [Pseudomonadota bacterium]
MNQKNRLNFIYVTPSVWGLLLRHDAWASFTQIETISYGNFLDLLDQERISDLYISNSSLTGVIRYP